MKYEYLIVGQGIAGTLLAEELATKNVSFCVIDCYNPESSSNIAAGLINPITGKRFVKSWNLEQFLSQALARYQELELKYQTRFVFKSDILRILENQKQENDLILRSEDSAYQDYLSVESFHSPEFVKACHSTAWIRNSWRIDMALLMKNCSQYLIDSDRLLQEKFDYDLLQIKANAFFYKDLELSKVIFCEGFNAINNPWFKQLPFELDKGELLIIRIPDFVASYTIKRKIAIIHLKEDIYWVGATNEWDFPDDQPSSKMKDWLLEHLDETLNLPYEILEHRAAIRPTVRDRRPFLGVHPNINNMYIFNGLGTKGALLAPWCAAQLTGLLLENKLIDKELDISRF